MRSGHRADTTLDLAAAAALVENGMTVGLSGFAHQNPPMAIVRELIRRGVRGLTVVSGPTSGIETDLLIGAGAVRPAAETDIDDAVDLEHVAAIQQQLAYRRHHRTSGRVSDKSFFYRC